MGENKNLSYFFNSVDQAATYKPEVDITPALNDLYDLCGIDAIRGTFEEKDGETIEKFHITEFGENYADVIKSIFEREVKPLLKKSERLRVAKRESLSPHLVKID